MAKRLKNLLVAEVSLVDKGANNKRFYLMKAANKDESGTETPDKAPEPTAIEKALSAPADGEAPDADPTNDLAVALKRVAKASGLDEAGLKTVLGLKDPEPVIKAEPKDPLADLSPEARAAVDAVFKAQAEAVAKAEILARELEAEREAKDVAEAIQKAATEFKNLPEKAEAVGAALRTLRKAAPEATSIIEGLLKRADALIAQGGLEPKGVAPAKAAEFDGLSTYERVVKRAKALVEKGEVKTVQAGVDMIFRAEPELYQAHAAEKKG